MYNLGERLFYDKLLSSNRDVACASCHLDSKGTSNGYSIGPSGQVLGGRITKNLSVEDLLPRNAPHLFNVGHRSQRSMFWDGRVEVSAQARSGFNTPAGDDLPLGLNSALAAQSLFPLVNPKEMGCGLGESLQSLDPKEQWQKVMDKVLAKPDYKLMFAEAFPDVGDWGIEHLANAIAVFEATKWRSWNSRFDQFLTGNSQALSEQEKQGALYFYGKGDCARCHSGPLLSDLKYHGIALPQFGPGMGDHPANQGDQGRARVTESEVDRYRFKTPSLRNVTMTGPWGHNGAFSDLKRFISHYRNPYESLRSWSLSEIILAPQFRPEAITHDLMGAMKYPETIANLMQASEVKGVPLTDQEMHLILQFLGTLSDYPQKQSY
jgi:cytochrome c peroxidase